MAFNIYANSLLIVIIQLYKSQMKIMCVQCLSAISKMLANIYIKN